MGAQKYNYYENLTCYIVDDSDRVLQIALNQTGKTIKFTNKVYVIVKSHQAKKIPGIFYALKYKVKPRDIFHAVT